jgi:hypothetical protein
MYICMYIYVFIYMYIYAYLFIYPYIQGSKIGIQNYSIKFSDRRNSLASSVDIYQASGYESKSDDQTINEFYDHDDDI